MTKLIVTKSMKSKRKDFSFFNLLKNFPFTKNEEKCKKKPLENQLHNILRLSTVLGNFLLTTSEAMGGHYLSTWYIRVAERLRILGNYELLGKCLNFRESKPSVQAP